jgi:hypothetical protein
MDLAVDRRELAVGVEHEARVRRLLATLAPFDDRPPDERDSVRTRPVGHGGNGLAAFERLGRGVVQRGIADCVPLLREDDDVRARRCSLRDEPLRRFKVCGFVCATRHLHARDTNPIGHEPRIALRR